MSSADRRLLDYPPTESTWLCRAKRDRDGAKVECGAPNSGALKKCWACATPRPSKPKRLWPHYLELCKRFGVTPGTRRPFKPVPEPSSKTASTKRKGN